MLQFFSQFTKTQIINQVIQSNFNYPISENLDIPRALRQKKIPFLYLWKDPDWVDSERCKLGMTVTNLNELTHMSTDVCASLKHIFLQF